MRRALAGALALAALTIVSIASGATPTNQKGTTYVSQSGGYALTLPTTWKLVPRTTTQMKALIATLAKKKATAALADAYKQIMNSAAGRAGMKAYDIQAFAWPADPSTPIPTEVSLGIEKTSRAYGKKDLPAVGAEYANELSANKGSKVAVPKIVTLPAGPAELIYASIPAGGGFSTGVELYLIPHGKRLYELSFQIDAQYLQQATLFPAIAKLLKFV